MVSSRRLLPVLLLLSAVAWLALRLLIALQLQATDPATFFQPDSHTYEQPALAMLQSGRFSEGPDRLDQPQITRTPGYPILIAAVYAIAGPRPLAVVAVQLALALATAFLAGLVARELMLACHPASAGRAQAWATGLALLDPVSFNYAYKLLTETLAAFLTALLAWLLLAGVRRLRASGAGRGCTPLGWGAAAGLLVAAGMFVRPIGFLLGPPLALWALWALRSAGVPRARRLISCVLLIAIWGTAYAGWCARNERVSGWSGFSAISSYNLLYYRAGGALAWRQGIARDAAEQQIREAHPLLETLPPAERAAERSRVARAYFSADPAALAGAQFFGLAKLVFDAGDADLWQTLGGDLGPRAVLREFVSRGPAAFVRDWLPGHFGWFSVWLYCMGFMAIVYGGAASGAGRLLRQGGWRTAAPWLMVGLIAYFALLSAGAEAYARFRVPFMPCLLALAACGWAGSRTQGNSGTARASEVGASTL